MRKEFYQYQHELWNFEYEYARFYINCFTLHFSHVWISIDFLYELFPLELLGHEILCTV